MPTKHRLIPPYRRLHNGLAAVLLLLCMPISAAPLTIAAAADLRFALDALIDAYRLDHPQQRIDPVYGSSGMLYTQIQQGAPFDLYFSADSRYPRQLAELGLAASAVLPYACGRLVLWRAGTEQPAFTLDDLGGEAIGRLAIANPEHAPYGQRAVEVLQSLGQYERLRPRLVIGENIAQAAQFAQSGAVDAGIIALSLALAPSFQSSGQYTIIPAKLHQPLEQGFIITRQAADPAAARAFAAYLQTPAARAIFQRFGFELPQAHAESSNTTSASTPSPSVCAE
ncbi:MAG: molybdate ABC transporter substrate-binding protein [Lysobacterales bacterium]